VQTPSEISVVRAAADELGGLFVNVVMQKYKIRGTSIYRGQVIAKIVAFRYATHHPGKNASLTINRVRLESCCMQRELFYCY